MTKFKLIYILMLIAQSAVIMFAYLVLKLSVTNSIIATIILGITTAITLKKLQSIYSK